MCSILYHYKRMWVSQMFVWKTLVKCKLLKVNDYQINYRIPLSPLDTISFCFNTFETVVLQRFLCFMRFRDVPLCFIISSANVSTKFLCFTKEKNETSDFFFVTAAFLRPLAFERWTSNLNYEINIYKQLHYEVLS